MKTTSLRFPFLLLIASIAAIATIPTGELRAQSDFFVDDRPATVKPDRPCPSNTFRYRSCNNGTVVDQVTGLVWVRSAGCVNYPGAGGSNLADWPTAMTAVAALGDGVCGLADGSQPGDWRLPTRREWETTLGHARDALGCGGSGAPVYTNNEGTGCYDPTFPFNAVRSLQATEYWSSTVDGLSTSKVESADLETGATDTSLSKSATARIWAVRDPR